MYVLRKMGDLEVPYSSYPEAFSEGLVSSVADSPPRLSKTRYSQLRPAAPARTLDTHPDTHPDTH